jgi:hypothetical protein
MEWPRYPPQAPSPRCAAAIDRLAVFNRSCRPGERCHFPALPRLNTGRFRRKVRSGAGGRGPRAIDAVGRFPLAPVANDEFVVAPTADVRIVFTRVDSTD